MTQRQGLSATAMAAPTANRAQAQAAEPGPTPYAGVLRLQRAAGNRAVSTALGGTFLGAGQALEADVRAHMELLLGTDFRDVRVHTDARASETARLLGASAYSVGRNLVFRSGSYAPATGRGRWLLAHELAHVTQSDGPPAGPGIGRLHDPYEQAADRAASLVAAGQPVAALPRGPAALRLTADPRLGTALERIREVRGDPPDRMVQRILAAIEGIDLTDPDNLEPIAAAVDAVASGPERRTVIDQFAQQVQARTGQRGPSPEELARSNRQLTLLQVQPRGPYGQVGPGVLLPVAAQAARPLLPVYEALAESALVRTFAGGLLGEWNEDPTFGMIAVDTVVSLVPILDQASDARDLAAHLYFLTGQRQYDRFLRWVGLAFSLIGLIPEVGSAIKGASKFVIKGGKEVIAHLPEVLRLVRRISPTIGDLSHFRRFVVDNWDTFLAQGLEIWTTRLAQARSLLARFPASEGRRLFADALERVRELSPAKLREAFAWIKQQVLEVVDSITPRPSLALPGGGSIPESALGAGTRVESRALGEAAGGAGGKSGGLTVELTEKQSKRLKKVSEALEDETKWGNVSPYDRLRLGKVYEKILEELIGTVLGRVQKALHYVDLDGALIKQLRAAKGRVLITEGRLSRKGAAGLRFDLLEIDFAKGTAELLDLTATSSARHIEKTKAYKDLLEKLLGLPVTAKELIYTGPNGELLETLVEHVVK